MIADEEAFVDRLADLDEALATGNTPQPDSLGATPPDLRDRLQRGMMALQALRGLRDSDATPHYRPGAIPDFKRPKQFGRFEIVRELGRGGFGVVFQARDPRLGRDIALKVPLVQSSLSSDLRARFHREAMAAAGLDHPNLVPVYEVGEIEGVQYIVSAFVPGQSLAGWLVNRPPVPFADAADLIAQLADGVAYAHSKGVIHRDLKPANILLHGDRESGVPKITDFGLAKLTDGPGNGTQSGAALGTPCYMAPEQASGRTADVGPAADVYALGVILYELLTGQPPFRGESDLETIQLVTDVAPLLPRRIRPKLPRDLEMVCLKCLEKRPGDRYTSATALSLDLRRFLEGRPVLARPIGHMSRTIRWCRRKPVIAILAAALLLAVGIGAASLFREQHRINAERLREQSRLADDAARSKQLADSTREATDKTIALGHALVHEKAEAHARQALEVARENFRSLRTQGPMSAEAQEKAAVVAYRLSVLYADAGKFRDYEEVSAEAAELYESLLATDPSTRKYRHRLVAIYKHQAGNFHIMGKSRRGKACRVKAYEHARELVRQNPQEPEGLLQVGVLQALIGQVARSEGDWVLAGKATAEGIAAMELIPEDKQDMSHIGHLADLKGRLSVIALHEGKLAYADQLAHEALATAADAASREDHLFGIGHCRGWALACCGHVRVAQGRIDEALTYFDEATQELGKYIRRERLPAVRFAAGAMFEVVIARADLLDSRGRGDEAIAVLRAALAIRPAETPGGYPRVPPVTSQLDAYCALISRLAKAGNREEANKEITNGEACLVAMDEPLKAHVEAYAKFKAVVAAARK